MEPNVNVRIIQGNNDKIDFNFITDQIKEEIKELNRNARLIIAKPLIKSALSNLIQNIMVGTSLNLYSTTSNITDQLIEMFQSTESSVSSNLLKCIIDNELFSIALTSSLMSSKDYAEDLNKALRKTKALSDDIIEILYY